MAYIAVTAPEGYLVNGLLIDEEYRYGKALTVRFSTTDGVDSPAGYVIYRSDGSEIARIEANGSYVIEEMGSYYALPVFE